MEHLNPNDAPHGIPVAGQNAGQDSLTKATERGITYLNRHQYPNGEFCGYIAPHKAMPQACVPDNTVVLTVILANTLLAGAPPAPDRWGYSGAHDSPFFSSR